MYIPYKTKKNHKKESKHDKECIIILHNVNYIRTVAESFQIAHAFRVKEIIISGNTPKPPFGKDIQKASLQGEKNIKWQEVIDIHKFIIELKKKNYKVFAYNPSENSKNPFNMHFAEYKKVCLLFGNEKSGLSKLDIEKVNCEFHIPSNIENNYINLNFVINLAIIKALYK